MITEMEIAFLALVVFFVLPMLVMVIIALVLNDRDKKRQALLYKQWVDESKKRILKHYADNSERVNKILCKRRKKSG